LRPNQMHGICERDQNKKGLALKGRAF
jgi:hypothetical protein